MGSAQEPRERALRNPVVAGHIRVYNPLTGVQRSTELITSDARNLAGHGEFYFCTHWEGRTGEAARYWRVIVENADGTQRT